MTTSDPERSAQGDSLGARIRRARRDLDLTLEELAEAAGVGVPFLSKVENGRQLPSRPVAAAIADRLGVPFPDLLADPDIDAAREWLARVYQDLQEADMDTEELVARLTNRLIQASLPEHRAHNAITHA